MKRFVALALMTAACSGSGSTPTLAPGPTDPPPTSSTSEAVSTTVTIASTSTSTLPASSSTSTEPPSVSIPIPETEGETDFAVIWQELVDYHNWAFQNPELAEPAVYLTDDCDCLERAQEIVDEYVDNGWAAVGAGLVVHEVDVRLSSGSFALMRIVDEQTPLLIVDASGVTVESLPRRAKTFFDVRVRLTETGWRIAEWNQRGAEGAAE